MHLLDTNIVIELFTRRQETIELIDSLRAVCSCEVVLGELYFGAHNSARAEKNLENVRRFTSLFPILSADQVTSEIYGQLKSTLRVIGRPAPDNDIWIAAIAKQYDFTVVTRDAHFSSMPGIRVLQ